MANRLPAHLEVAALVRSAEAAGDFATVLRKGDPDLGSVVLLVASRGRHVSCLERVLDVSGDYRWNGVGPADSASSADVQEFLARRARFDEDLWVVELDIADAERFIAETISFG